MKKKYVKKKFAVSIGLINELSNQRRWKENAISQSWGGQFPWCQKIGGCLVLVCPVSGVGKKELGDGQNKKSHWLPARTKKKEGKEWAGPPTSSRVRYSP
jgi:hypothetical protein